MVNAVEGWGKTSLGAFAPDPAILMAGDETGYLTLLSQGLVPNVLRGGFDTWQGFLEQLDEIANDADSSIKTVVVDALGGFERMCHQHVCTRDFKGIWGEKGFNSYQRGYEQSVNDWMGLLAKLDRIRNSKKAGIILLSHCQVRSFKNPLGPDFDRYVADIHVKTWSVTHRWADAVLFGNFPPVIAEEKGRARGIGSDQKRVAYTQHTDAYDAKNRFGMEEEIEMPTDPSGMWDVVEAAIKAGRKN